MLLKWTYCVSFPSHRSPAFNSVLFCSVVIPANRWFLLLSDSEEMFGQMMRKRIYNQNEEIFFLFGIKKNYLNEILSFSGGHLFYIGHKEFQLKISNYESSGTFLNQGTIFVHSFLFLKISFAWQWIFLLWILNKVMVYCQNEKTSLYAHKNFLDFFFMIPDIAYSIFINKIMNGKKFYYQPSSVKNWKWNCWKREH